jgi:hypothetical protein
MLDGNREIPRELRAKRTLPTLAAEYIFSVTAQFELNSIEESTDRRIISRLKDDLITTVIPSCKQDCEDAERKARRRVIAECPPKELELAKTILERELIRKAASRTKNLKGKRKRYAGATERRREPPSLLDMKPGHPRRYATPRPNRH